jgi:hypothetical protein
LRALLLGCSPQDIAIKVVSTAGSVSSTLSQRVYPAIKLLCDIDSSQELQWGQVTTLLEKYRITTLTLEQLWQNLEQQATQTDKMYPVSISPTPQVQGLDWDLEDKPKT